MTMDAQNIPGFHSVPDLEEFLSRPRPEVCDALRKIDGDLMVLGVAGKMGPTLALLAQRCIQEAGLDKKVIGVSRFSDPQVAERLSRAGVIVLHADLLNPDSLRQLPSIPNIVYMAGMKFGTTGQEAATWAQNAFLPGLVALRFKESRMVVFSSGNVYPLSPISSGGCIETSPLGPIGEYAQSVLGRERVFEHFSKTLHMPGLLLRLNYAVEMRYGVLWDIATKVWESRPVDVTMGYVNVIWQGDANAAALRGLDWVECPPRILNLTGQDTLSVRDLASRFAKILGKDLVLEGAEQPDALLSNAHEAARLLGAPQVPIDKVIEWVADWVSAGRESLGKPTKFQVRDGRF